MSSNAFPTKRWDISGTDSNSLLRFYDLATGVFNTSPSQLERVKASKAIERIAKELQKRKVAMSAVLAEQKP